jgi:thiosulfate dehydrogenase [quinone] large subunit
MASTPSSRRRRTGANERPAATNSSAPPPRAWALSGWALLPLRLFLGATFLFAGLQKLANPNFFNANSPSSIQAQLIASARLSPLHALVGHLLQFATPLGILISLGEIAVGLGMLLGLWTRIAALGGTVLALTLFLTVSFHASPYYTGADIVFFFAFFPFMVAGSGGVWSFDGRIARRANEEAGLGDPTPYALSFVQVQDLCGHYERGRCSAQRGAACAPSGCPVLEGGRQPIVARRRPDEVDRRTVVLGSTAAVAAGLAGVVLGGAVAGLGRAIGGAAVEPSNTKSLGGPTTRPTTGPSSGATTTTGATPAGTALGKASDVPVGGAATFTSANGDPGIVVQPSQGSFEAYDAVCPHAGCTVSYSKAAGLLVCPCHASEFKVSSGDVVAGPSPRGLTKYKIAEGSDGVLYLQT